MEAEPNENGEIKFRGFKGKYRVSWTTEKGEEKEVVKFYITDDKNHLPVRLDLNLNFGTAKAFLTGASGIRNPQTAKLK